MILFDIFLLVVPRIVRNYITSPKQNVWSKLIYLFGHFIKHGHGGIAISNTSINTGSVGRVFRSSVFRTTTKNIIAEFVGAHYIVKVQVQVGELYDTDCFAN